MRFRFRANVRKSLVVLLSYACINATAQQNTSRSFIKAADSLRDALRIPGMAVAIAVGDSVIFASGLGYADIEQKVRANAETVFRIASVTKTFTSTIIMQLVEEGKLTLDEPIAKYGIDFGNDKITIRHLLTHTSEGTPGTGFKYNGYRFGKLGMVIEKASGQPFYRLLMQNIVQPLRMLSTAPGISLSEYFPYVMVQPELKSYFENAFAHLAKPYDLDLKKQIYRTSYLDEFGAFGGLASTVKDLLKYSMAIDHHRFVSASTQHKIFTAVRTNSGQLTPYGLGWFIYEFDGTTFYWHYGQTQGESALFIKVPSQNIAFICMANTDKLSQPFPMGDGDLMMSPVAQLFYRFYIPKKSEVQAIDYNASFRALSSKLRGVKDSVVSAFYKREIITRASICLVNGDTTSADAMYKLYSAVNFKNDYAVSKSRLVASIDNVGINKDTSRTFFIDKEQKLRVEAVGENCSDDFSFWCDFGIIEDEKGQVLWQMSGKKEHAGGAIKNQKVTSAITLKPGKYRIRYKSDAGHAYGNWDSLPPENYSWGIGVYQD